MGARQKDWARRKRVDLLNVLGDKCVECGATEKLEFDCIVPCGDKHHKMEPSTRMSFYHAQHRAKNLQILCTHCNARKGDKIPVDETEPF